MPQLIVLAIAGAGLFAGYKWLSRKVVEHSEAAKVRAEAAAAAASPKEMGQLEWDAEAQAYRPVRR